MGDANSNGSTGFASRVIFASLTGIGVAFTTAYAAILMRVHHLPYFEGLPEQFHPKALIYSAITFVVFLAIVVPFAYVIPISRENLWRRLSLSFGVALCPIGAGFASRHMTELFDMQATPGWGVIVAIALGAGVVAYAIFYAADAMSQNNVASLTIWAFITTAFASVAYYASLNSAIATFDQFALSLQYLILVSAALATGLAIIVMKRHSKWWLRGIAAYFAVLLLTSVPFSFGGPRIKSNAELTTSGDKPQHIILITVDTMRADVLSCYGGKDAAPTPNLDGLAADSVMFMNATTHAPWTLPSLSTLFTGEDPRVHQCVGIGRRIPDRFKTLAEYFSEAGYHTQAIVHNAFLRQEYQFSQGFDGFDFVEHVEMGLEINPLRRNSLLCTRRHDFSSTSLMVTVHTLRFLRQIKDRPYFLWIHFFDPHQPYRPPDRLLEDIGRIGKGDVMHSLFKESSDPNVSYAQIEKSKYKSEVRYVDECMGRILNELKVQGVYDSALIGMTSDHGEEFAEHGGFTHAHTLYNELLHVPLLWKNPGARSAGLKIEERVPMAGLRGALLERMGFSIEDQDPLVAPSILPFIEGTEPKPVMGPFLGGAIDPALRQGNSIIADEWKLIERTEKSPELYDLSQDPGEQTNLFESNPEKAEHLKSLFLEKEAALKLRREALQLNVEDESFLLDEKSQDELRRLGYLK